MKKLLLATSVAITFTPIASADRLTLITGFDTFGTAEWEQSPGGSGGNTFQGTGFTIVDSDAGGTSTIDGQNYNDTAFDVKVPFYWLAGSYDMDDSIVYFGLKTASGSAVAADWSMVDNATSAAVSRVNEAGILTASDLGMLFGIGVDSSGQDEFVAVEANYFEAYLAYSEDIGASRQYGFATVQPFWKANMHYKMSQIDMTLTDGHCAGRDTTFEASGAIGLSSETQFQITDTLKFVTNSRAGSSLGYIHADAEALDVSSSHCFSRDDTAGVDYTTLDRYEDQLSGLKYGAVNFMDSTVGFELDNGFGFGISTNAFEADTSFYVSLEL